MYKKNTIVINPPAHYRTGAGGLRYLFCLRICLSVTKVSATACVPVFLGFTSVLQGVFSKKTVHSKFWRVKPNM